MDSKQWERLGEEPLKGSEEYPGAAALWEATAPFRAIQRTVAVAEILRRAEVAEPHPQEEG